jgi:hypothetical protein
VIESSNLFDFEKVLKDLVGIESVGYYVGGMKQKDFKKSESCKSITWNIPNGK